MNYSFEVDKDLFYLIEQSLALILKIAINNIARLEKCQEESSDWIECLNLERTINLEKSKANDISGLIESLAKQERIQSTMEKIRLILDKRIETGEVILEPTRSIRNPYGKE